MQPPQKTHRPPPTRAIDLKEWASDSDVITVIANDELPLPAPLDEPPRVILAEHEPGVWVLFEQRPLEDRVLVYGTTKEMAKRMAKLARQIISTPFATAERRGLFGRSMNADEAYAIAEALASGTPPTPLT